MGGRELLGKNYQLPRWADLPLRSLKYLTSPYGLVADVKMLELFRAAGRTTIQVCLVLVILSVVTKNFWCRYLCTYGALMGLLSLLSPTRIVRDPVSCIDCGKCRDRLPVPDPGRHADDRPHA